MKPSKSYKVTNGCTEPNSGFTSMINKVAFISYPVADLDRSVTFYRDVLGFNLLFIKNGWAEFEIDGQRLALCEEKISSDPGHRVEPGHRTGAAVYFAARPIEEAVASLQQKGVSFTGELESYSYGKLICFSDPDGNALGLYESSTS